MLIALATLSITGQILAQSANEDATKREIFYREINETLRHQLQFYSKRCDCIVKKLKSNDVYGKVNTSHYSFYPVDGGYNVTFISKELLLTELEPFFDDANFSCTIVGFCSIILIVSVMFLVLFCVSCLSKKK